MDIDRIRYFQIFCESGSLVKASEILHISQPALSKALRQLEHEVGAKLLEPDGRGLRLTEAGRLLRQETAPLLDKWLSVPARIKGAGGAEPTRIGSFEVFTTYFLGHLSNFLELDRLEVHEFMPGALEDAIAGGQVDVGITYVPIPKAGVEFVEVTKVKMGVFGLAKAFKDMPFENLPFVAPLHPASGTPSKVIGLDGWPDHRFAREIRFRVTMMESAMELCRRGLAVAYLPEFVVHLHNEYLKTEHRLSEFESPVPHKERGQSVFLVRPQNAGEGKLQRLIAKALRQLS